MPGVNVTTAFSGGLVTDTDTDSGQLFMVGITERGDTSKALLLRGMADVTALLGNVVSYGAAWDQLNTFFAEGGQQCYFARVVGPSATLGTLTLKDRSTPPGVNTLRIDAIAAGDWSTQITVQVRDGSVANTFRITVYLNGIMVEDATNLVSPLDAVARFAASNYIRVVNLSSVTVAPNNNPVVLAATALSAGGDDRASITTTHYLAALDKFTKDLGDGAVAIPGQTGTTIFNGIIAHCVANSRIGILAAGRSETVGNLTSAAIALNTEYAGLFAPWIVVADGTYGTKAISPEGYVAAARARAHYEEGAWRVPAGQISEAITVLDVDQTFTNTEMDTLDAAKVSLIRQILGGIRLYGWKSLSADQTNYTYLKERDLLNYLVVQAAIILEEFVFENVDAAGRLLSDIESALEGMVAPIADAGGLYPQMGFNKRGRTRELDPGYRVDTGSTVNTALTLAAGEVRAQLLVRTSPVGGYINLTIVKVGFNSNLQEV